MYIYIYIIPELSSPQAITQMFFKLRADTSALSRLSPALSLGTKIAKRERPANSKSPAARSNLVAQNAKVQKSHDLWLKSTNQPPQGKPLPQNSLPSYISAFQKKTLFSLNKKNKAKSDGG